MTRHAHLGPYSSDYVAHLDPLEDETKVGVRAPVAAKQAGISYRQLDYWATSGFITPTGRAADGSGTQRLYTPDDVVLLRDAADLLAFGMSLQRLRTLDPATRARLVDAIRPILEGS